LLPVRNFLLFVSLGSFVPLVASAVEADPYAKYLEDSTYNEDLEVPWVELETKVKQLPEDQDLVEVDMSSLPPGMQLYIDMKNIEVGKDYVTRTWLVARSTSGAYNASYEGLKCSDRSYKVYAYYNPVRSTPLRKVNLPRWKEASRSGNYRYELMEDFLCSGPRPEPVNDIFDNIGSDANTYDLIK